MAFTRPLLLLPIALLPYFAYLGWPRVRFGRARAWAGLVLRCLIVALVTLSLAGIQSVRGGDELAVVFLVDASDSIPEAEQHRALAFVAEALTSMGPEDAAALILFAADALVERPMTRSTQLTGVASVPRTHHTNLEGAVRLGLALFPTGAARRMVLLTDGRPTTGDTEAAVRLARAQGVQVDVVNVGAPPGAEAWLSDLNLPTRVHQREEFTLSVVAESTTPMEAVLTVLSGDEAVAEQTVRLSPGSSRFAVPLVADEPGLIPYRVLLRPEIDVHPQNNALSALIHVEGPPRVLVVAADPAEALPLQEALRAAGLSITESTAGGMPSDPSALAAYAAVVVVDVPARALHPGAMRAMQSYVRDLGGGLVAIGGPNAYGLGGWYDTPLEEVLPVEMAIRDPERFPPMSIVVITDKSGSMAAEEGGVQKIRLAGEAAARVAELINDLDEITVIAFDDRPADIIGPLPGSRREEVIEKVIRLQAGGGGIYVRESLQTALDTLHDSDDPVRHIILLADGSDSEHQEGVPGLVQREIASHNITLSTVAIGSGQDLGFLENIARVGGGRYYFTDRAANLPVIFAEETQLTMRSYLVEEPFFPRQATSSPVLAGIGAVPQLAGYVATSPKPTAQTILVTHEDDPLLAAWQYGLGRAVAWTSDATGRWAQQWINWQGFSRLWAQVVRWTVTQQADVPVEVAVTLEGETAHVTVDAANRAGEFVNGVETTLSVVGPGGGVTRMVLPQTAPGRYEESFEPQAEGVYVLRLSGTLGEDEVIALTTGWVLGYSPEYAALEADPGYLGYLADLGGGQVLDEPREAFARTIRGQAANRDLWPCLLGLATLLLPLDIGVRRLVLGRRDLERAWKAVRSHLPPGRPRSAAEAPSPLGRFLQAKARARRSRPPGVEQKAQAPNATAPPAPRPTTPKRAPSPPTPPVSDEDTLAGRLLRRRKERRQKGNGGDA